MEEKITCPDCSRGTKQFIPLELESHLIKTLPHAFYFVILSLAATLLSACGTMGGTTRSVVQLETLPSIGQMRSVSVGSVAREDEGIRLMNVGVFGWGKFSDEDQTNIEASLSDTLLTVTRKSGQPSGDPIKIHVLIRKYYVGSSNNAVAIFAGIDWVSAGPTNQILFQESFYATSECHFPRLCTLGSQKDVVNSAIIKRIAQKAITLAAGGRPESISIEGTYSTFESAAATMPETLRSWGTMFLAGSVPVFLPGSGPAKVALEWAEMKTPVDWEQRLTNAPR